MKHVHAAGEVLTFVLAVREQGLNLAVTARQVKDGRGRGLLPLLPINIRLGCDLCARREGNGRGGTDNEESDGREGRGGGV